MSDKELASLSNLLSKLEPGDGVMADKGFDIQDLLAPIGAKLNIPPFMEGGQQMSVQNVVKTRNIASLRIHVGDAWYESRTFISLIDPFKYLFAVLQIKLSLFVHCLQISGAH